MPCIRYTVAICCFFTSSVYIQTWNLLHQNCCFIVNILQWKFATKTINNMHCIENPCLRAAKKTQQININSIICPHRVHFRARYVTLCTCIYYFLQNKSWQYLNHTSLDQVAIQVYIQKYLYRNQIPYHRHLINTHHTIHYSCNHSNLDYILWKKTITKSILYD